MFLEVEEAQDMPVAGTLQLGPRIHTKIKIDDRPQQSGNRIQDDNGASERGRGYRTKAAQERGGPRASRFPSRESLVCYRAKQCDRDQAVND